MPIRLCEERGCGDEALRGGRCEKHAAAHRRSVRPRPYRIYSLKRWQTTRRRKLAQDPICERCGMVLADEVHHKVPLQDGGAPWLFSNLESLCKPCHNAETNREMAER